MPSIKLSPTIQAFAQGITAAGEVHADVERLIPEGTYDQQAALFWLKIGQLSVTYADQEVFDAFIAGVATRQPTRTVMRPSEPIHPGSVTDSDTGIEFIPWTDGWAVGFRLVHQDGHEEYIYLNPSSDGGGDPDHRSNVFVYQGKHGDPAMDTPYVHFNAEHDSPPFAEGSQS